MRLILVILSLFLFNCTGPNTQVVETDENDFVNINGKRCQVIKVDRKNSTTLFFIDCDEKGKSTTYTYQVSCGKNCTRTETVSTTTNAKDYEIKDALPAPTEKSK